MTDIITICVIGFIFLAGIVAALAISSSRHKRDLREYLEPDLKKCGINYVSSIYPGIFKVGPFPKIESERGRPQSTIGGIRGEYSEYRIVDFEDSNGSIHRVWAQIEFEVFQFRRVRWRAESKQKLPANVLSILEN